MLLIALSALALVSKAFGTGEPVKTSLSADCMGTDGRVPSFVEAVKRRLKQPASFEHLSTRIAARPDRQGYPIGMTYQAKNTFGDRTRTVAWGKVAPGSCASRVIGFQ